MSVDFYPCKCCNESRYSEYVACCSGCGNRICVYCVVNDDIDSQYAYDYGVKFDNSPEQREEFGVKSKEEDPYGLDIGEIIDDTGVAEKYCPFCNGNKVNNDDLLNYLLTKFNIDKEVLKVEYLAK